MAKWLIKRKIPKYKKEWETIKNAANFYMWPARNNSILIGSEKITRNHLSPIVMVWSRNAQTKYKRARMIIYRPPPNREWRTNLTNDLLKIECALRNVNWAAQNSSVIARCFCGTQSAMEWANGMAYLYVIRAFLPMCSSVCHSDDGKMTPENDVSSINCSDTAN